MGFCVCQGALLQCTFGNAPSSLSVLPLNMVNVSSKPIAVITDNVPMMNIMPFGMCMSLSNPTVASATSAALGVLTPMPCIPATVSPWTPGSPTVLVKGKPAVTDSSMLTCMWGGVIKCNFAGQVQTQAK